MSRRTLTTFPSSFFRRAPVVIGATACKGTSPAARDSDRPRPALFRQPAKADGIPRIGVPSTVATAGKIPGSASRSRRPHVLPMAGDNVLERALQAQRHETCRHLVAPCVATSREQVAFTTSLGGGFSPGSCEPAPGTDDPSAPTWLGLLGHRRELIALAVPNRPQRLDGFYD
jgi:hypothetical protein